MPPGTLALFFVSEASASPQKPVNRAKRLKDCLWKFLQLIWKSLFWLFRDVSLCKFIFSSAFIPVGNDVAIRKSLLCAVMALLLHLSEAAVSHR